MAKAKRKGRFPAKKERTLNGLLVLRDDALARAGAQHDVAMAILREIYAPWTTPSSNTYPMPKFYGAFVHESGDLLVYGFSWTMRRREVVPCWSSNRYDTHIDQTLYRQVTGNRWTGDPLQQLAWEAEWERLVGLDRADLMRSFYEVQRREDQLWGRYWAVVNAIKRVLVREAWPVTEEAHEYEKDVPTVRFNVDGRLITLVSNDTVVFGDPDAYRDLSGSTKVYDNPIHAVPSWRLQERAQRGKK